MLQARRDELQHLITENELPLSVLRLTLEHNVSSGFTDELRALLCRLHSRDVLTLNGREPMTARQANALCDRIIKEADEIARFAAGAGLLDDGVAVSYESKQVPVQCAGAGGQRQLEQLVCPIREFLRSLLESSELGVLHSNRKQHSAGWVAGSVVGDAWDSKELQRGSRQALREYRAQHGVRLESMRAEYKSRGRELKLLPTPVSASQVRGARRSVGASAAP